LEQFQNLGTRRKKIMNQRQNWYPEHWVFLWFYDIAIWFCSDSVVFYSPILYLQNIKKGKECKVNVFQFQESRVSEVMSSYKCCPHVSKMTNFPYN
jgi:hypothetical protein